MRIENAKKSGLYAASGVLIAAIIIAGIFASGIHFPSNIKTGKLIVLITDAPVDIKRLDLTVDSLSIQGLNGNWIDLTLNSEEEALNSEEEVTFNLLEFNNAVTMKLSETDEIPAGKYTMLKMHISQASAMLQDETSDSLLLKVPSEYLKVLLKPPLEIDEGRTTIVLIDLEPDLSTIVISQSLNLKPVVKAIFQVENQ